MFALKRIVLLIVRICDLFIFHNLKNDPPACLFHPARLLDSGEYILDTVQDFLIKLGIKPRMHLLEIGIFSLCHVIIRPTKIMNRADKNWAHF